LEQQPIIQPFEKSVTEVKEIVTEGVTPLHDVGGGYIEFDKGLYKTEALKELRPDLFSIKADSTNQITSNFGISFPKIGKKGDIFVRVDTLPNRVFKFDGQRWIEINKDSTTSYLDNSYLEYIIKKVNTGEIDLDTLTEAERQALEAYLKGNQNS
jgi:hypothetical protein